MKLRLYISLIIFITYLPISWCQVLAPLGEGISGKVVDMVTTVNDELVVCHVEEDKPKVSVWNGYFWRNLDGLSVGLLSDEETNQRRVHHLAYENDEVFLVIENIITGNRNFELWRWSKGQWSMINHPLIQSANSIDYITYLNNEIQLIGKFRSSGVPYNVVSINHNRLTVKGNTVARNFTNDNFLDVINTTRELVAVGNFTVPSQGVRTMAAWNGDVWQLREYPAFLKENSRLGTHQGATIVFGSNLDGTVGVRKQSGNAWIEMSQGLNHFEVKDVRKFVDYNGQLFCVGKFIENATNITSELIVYDGFHWNKVELNHTKIDGLTNFNDNLVLFGDLQTSDVPLNVGVLKDEVAGVFIRVFEDKNENGIKDENEDYLSNVSLTEQISGAVISSNQNGTIYYESLLRPVNFAIHDRVLYKSTTENIDIRLQQSKAYGFYDVGVVLNDNVNDLNLKMTDFEGLFYTRGEFKKFLVCAQNNGTTDAENAIIELKPSGPYGLFNSNITPNLRDEDRIVWVVNKLPANDEFCIEVELEPLTENQFEIIGFVGWENISDDINKDNNSSRILYKNAPQLPNQKGSEMSFIPLQTEQLKYTIAFKNTTDRVLKSIRIVDEIDSQLYLMSGISYISTHDARLDRSFIEMPNGNYKYTCVWTLDNINLPSSSTDDINSEGAITFLFDIWNEKLKSGMEICNQAKIFFEYEDGYECMPLRTNTVCLDVSATDNTKLSTDKINIGSTLSVYPNPSDKFVTINNQSNAEQNVTVVNTMGQEVVNMILKSGENKTLITESWSSGIYLIQSNNQTVERLIVY